MLSLQTLAPFPSSTSTPTILKVGYGHRLRIDRIRCSLTGFQEMSVESEAPKLLGLTEKGKRDVDPLGQVDSNEEDENRISQIQVPRQKYIPVPKAALLDAIISTLFPSRLDDDDDDDAHDFLLLSSCLDSILHAEHKIILEEMRMDYTLTQPVENETSDDEGFSDAGGEAVYNGQESRSDREFTEDNPFVSGLDLRNLFNTSTKKGKGYINGESRVAVATRFQRAFMQLLKDAQFEQLSARDLMLTSALNSDYLLTLPVYVDWKRASESNAIIFRRGYAAERQKGLLIVEKLDYIQSKLLQGLFFVVSKPLGKLGAWINESLKDFHQTQELKDWAKKLKHWLKELFIFQKLFRYDEETSGDLLEDDQISDRDLPIWLAAQSAVSRYEGILSPVGPRGRLLKRLLTWIGLLSPTPEQSFKLDNDNNASAPYLRPIFLSRISLSDIWKPATKKYCGNDLWKRLKTSISILFSQSVLQEPAFQELILLYTKEMDDKNTDNKPEVPSLQLKIYEKIPIPDLPVIFPDKKLSFRIIDTVRLDAATMLGLLAYFINYKFENFLSSPSAVFLDVVAVSALIIYITRVALGYKQTWDRYQLLVNKTLYEKTVASSFGSVHFLLDASEQQQYKEAILAYAILVREEKSALTCRKSVGDKCEKLMYDLFKVKVEMPIDKAMNTLLRLGLVTEIDIDGRIQLRAIPCPKAYEALRLRWNSLLASSEME